MTTLSQKRILCAEALLLPPEAVAKWLEAMAPEKSSLLFGGIRSAHEVILFRRKHPLIDLALARFGTDERVLGRVFRRGNSGVRCAALANRFAGPNVSHGIFKIGFISSDEFHNLIKRGTRAELCALFQNEFLNDDVLEWLLQRKEVFAEIDEFRLQMLIFFLGDNPRLKKEYDGPIDGWAEYRHRAYAQHGWELSSIVPATERWANILIELYKNLPGTSNYEWVNSAIEKWQDDPENKNPQFSNKFWLRSRIANFIKDRLSCRDSDDLALRLSYYQNFNPENEAEIQLCYDKDKTDFLDGALRNDNFFIREDLREILKKFCWNEGREDYSLDYVNNFNSAFEYMQKKLGLQDEVSEAESPEMAAIRELQEQISQLREELVMRTSTNRKKWF
jgi:hypothetical protein